MRPLLRLLVALVAVTLVLPVRSARADLKLDGRWRQSPQRDEYTVQNWLEACGPAPQSVTTGGGELVEVRLEGDELAFVGGGRVYRTNQCYDPMPTLSRETHTRDPNGKIWRTRCVTAPADPRKAAINTLVVVTSDTQIDVTETGRYEIMLENGRCMADVKRTRTFTHVDTSPTPTTAPTPAPAPTKEPPKPANCAAPGEPQKLEVRPSKKLARTDETFKFRARVLDANGCETQTATTWKIATDSVGKGVTVDATGKVIVAKDAPEGTVEIVATAAGKDARVSVEVATPARYDDLLAQSGLNAAGENDEASSVTIASQSIGAGEGRVEDRSRERRMLFLAIIGGILFVLVILSVLLFRRARRAKALIDEAEERHEARVQQALDERRRREAEHAAQQRAHEESVKAARAVAERRAAAKMICPKCGREEASGTSFCPEDGAALAPASASAAASDRVCPVCRRAFGANVTVCPQDKVELVPASSVAAAAAEPPVKKRGKICPTCGERFPADVGFCGKDGTVLVLIN